MLVKRCLHYMYGVHVRHIRRTCTSYVCVVSDMLKTTCMCGVQATANMYVMPDGVHVRRTCMSYMIVVHVS